MSVKFEKMMTVLQVVRIDALQGDSRRGQQGRAI